MSWENERAEASMREAGKKIMEEAAKRKASEDKKETLFHYELKVISSGNHKQVDVDTINQKLNNLKNECFNDFENLELKITKFEVEK